MEVGRSVGCGPGLKVPQLVELGEVARLPYECYSYKIGRHSTAKSLGGHQTS
jgi:hypothetical protein